MIRQLLAGIPDSVRAMDMLEYADFWRARDAFTFDADADGVGITVTVSDVASFKRYGFSLYVHDNVEVRVADSLGEEVPTVSRPFQDGKLVWHALH